MVFGIASGGNASHIAPDGFQFGSQQMKGLIDEVGSPVVELSASAIQPGLPVITKAVTQTAEFDFRHAADDPRSHQFHHVIVTRLKAAVVPQIKFSGIHFIKLPELFQTCLRESKRLFQEHDLSRLQRFPCKLHMESGWGRDAHQFHIGIGKKGIGICISGSVRIARPDIFHAVRQHITAGCQLKK